jgi:hypothetical protein
VLQVRLETPAPTDPHALTAAPADDLVVTDAVSLPPATDGVDAAATTRAAAPEVILTEPPPPATPQHNLLQDFWPVEQWQKVMKLTLPVAGFVGLVCAAVLILLTIVGIQVNLIGRMPAMATMISAFYWSIITVALLFPWGSLINEPLSQVGDRIPWLFFTYGEIERAVRAGGDDGVQMLIWLRFMVWPVVSLAAAWMTGARFGKAYWHVVGLAEIDQKPNRELVGSV